MLNNNSSLTKFFGKISKSENGSNLEQFAKETNAVMFVQIYVQHHHTEIRPNSASGVWS